MDYTDQIADAIKKLRMLDEKLGWEVNELNKSHDQAKNDLLGFGNKVKMLLAAQVGRGVGMEAIMGESYARAKHHQFDNINDYADHIRHSIDDAKNAKSKIADIIAHLEDCQRKKSALVAETKSWLDRANQIAR